MKELIRASEISKKELKKQINSLDSMVLEGMRTLKGNDSLSLQKVKINIDKALRLAKEGKQSECLEILKEYGS